ncbi:MAG: lipopolysaccharide biosynthesis protein [Pseudomonadales bacterium]
MSTRQLSDNPSNDRLTIRSNFLALLTGRFFAALSLWLALIVVAKLSDPTTVGIYALAQAICLPMTEIARMGLREVRASDTVGEYEFGDYLGLRLLAIGVALAFMIAAGMSVSHSRMVLLVILFYALTRCLELFSDMIYGLFQSQERMDYIARSLCMLGPLSLVLLSIGFWLTGSLVVAILGQVLAHISIVLFYDLRVGRQRASLEEPASFWPQWNMMSLRKLAVQAMPLTFATALVMIALYLPRLAVDEFLGLEALGYFAALVALAMAPSRLVHALGMASSVRLAHHHAAGERGPFIILVAKMAVGAGAIGGAGVLLAAYFGEEILRLAYTEDYASYANILVWVVAAATIRFVADVLQFGMIASRRFWWLTFQYGSVALAAVVACYSFIPGQGLEGAALAVVVIFAVQLTVISIGLLCNLPAAERMEVAV